MNDAVGHQTRRSEHVPQLISSSRDTPLPLSLAQEAMWPFCQTPETSAVYVAARILQISGPLDIAMLSDCLDYIVRRHEILRTTFGVENGQPVQIVRSAAPRSLSIFEVAPEADHKKEATRIIRQEQSRTCDLNHGPLIRVSLLRISENEHWLLHICHYLLWDKWSTSLFHKELRLLYEAKHAGKVPPLPEFEPLQYGDYAHWQRKLLRRDGPVYQEAIAWWKERLQGLQAPLELPFKRPVPVPKLDPTEGVIEWPVDAELGHRLTRLSRNEAVTLYVIWLAALAAVLAAETEQPDVAVGTYMTNRGGHTAVQNMIGNFVNMVALRFQYRPSTSFRQWLSDVRSLVTSTQAHSEIPEVKLRSELYGLGVNPPPVQVIFAASMGLGHLDMAYADLKLSKVDLNGARGMPWGFSLTLVKRDLQTCLAFFDAEIYDPVGVRRFLGRICEFLNTASQHPDLSIAEIMAATG